MNELPAGFKTAANIKYWRSIGITVTQPTIAKAIMQMREDTIADKMDNGMSAEEAGRWADEHFAQVRGDRERDISINIVHEGALKNEIALIGSWISYKNTALLNLVNIHGDHETKKRGMQEVKEDAIHKIVATERERQESWPTAERESVEILYERAEREVCRKVVKEEDGLVYIHRNYLPQLKMKTDAIQKAYRKDTSEWIGSGNHPRFEALGISGSKATRDAAIRKLFRDSVREKAGENPTTPSLREAVRWVSKHVARCKPNRKGPDSWKTDGNWQVHESHLHELEHDYLNHEKTKWKSVEEMAKTVGITRARMLIRIKNFVDDQTQELVDSGMTQKNALQIIDSDLVAQVDWGNRKVYRVSPAGEDQMKDWWEKRQKTNRNGWVQREAIRRERESGASAGVNM